VDTPNRWSIEGSLTAGYCSASSLAQAIGAQGSITFTPAGTGCALTAQLTVFLVMDGEVVPIRVDANRVPIAGGMLSADCN
jgi:hypothetical protein